MKDGSFRFAVTILNQLIWKSTSEKIVTDYQKAHKRAELERLRIAREHQRELERKQKKLEKERQQRERQEKRDAEERKKEEKRLKRKEEQRKKEEERENERKKKEEEKRKKEEEKLQKEQEKKREEELKTQREEKQRAVLLGFLVKSEIRKETNTISGTDCGPFIQFEVRKDMRMAPLHRMSQALLSSKQSNIENLRHAWVDGNDKDAASSLGLFKFGRANYLHELRTGQILPLSYPSTWPIEPPEVEYLGDNIYPVINSIALKQHGNRGSGGTVWLRAKLFQFVENYRPAYYGTWRRRSRIVTGRRPFARDDYQLDYSIDSDDEWEEEEPGESITQSDFFVPHGYLSDDEGVAVEEGEGPIPDEMKQLRQQLSVAEYEAAHRRGLQRLKPLLLGPLWLPEPVECYIPSSNATTTNTTIASTNNNHHFEENKENIELPERYILSKQTNEKTEFQLMKSVLSVYRVHLWTTNFPISVEPDIVATTTTPSRRPKKSIPEEAMAYFIHLVHRSPLGKHKLAFEFRVFWHRHTTGILPECLHYMEYKKYNASTMGSISRGGLSVLSGPGWDNLPLSQSLVLSKLAEIAVFTEGRWIVNSEILQKYASRLCNLCNIQELSGGISGNLDKVDKDYFNNLVFPSWEYLTDVAVTSIRVNRGASTTNRRSLELPQSQLPPTVDRLHEPHKNIMTINNSPVVLLQPLQSSDVVVSSNQTDKESSIHKNEQSFQSKKIHSSEKDINLSVSISQENCSSKVTTTNTSTSSSHIPSRRKGFTNKIPTSEKDAPSFVNNSKEDCSSPKVTTTTTGSSQTPARKRVTLDSFLIPPAKRSNVNISSEIQSEEDCVIIVSK
ncbi:hypothetical protein Smp_169140 [Schistosoma mansoni]|uniref:hypothetical protein n=1 Tax=Schistosoma mansoni TaxID=6183 RepID=UPI00022C81C1|nr:hypothetical protein Smp_169140 [Schistosoma mansoni]|eukprot:XP_018647120.1 hypothetical protein Smp_169140 [Schistosoma mansoni]